MRYSHRRQIIRELATWLALPLTLGFGATAIDRANDVMGKARGPRLFGGTAALRPRVAAPKGSVMRRG